jgi:5-formyltetrahydrofolate cyclo-ligase
MRKSLRTRLRAARRRLSPHQQRLACAALSRRLHRDPSFRRARHIAFYLANDGEIDLLPLIRRQPTNKPFYLPLLSEPQRPWEATRLLFQAWNPSDKPLTKNRYGIFEPTYEPRKLRAASMLDMVLLPLVGFDRQGNRLGMGKGYYDRTFARRAGHWRQPKLLGVAHACQEVPNLPHATWDVPLDGVITDKEIIWCLPRSASAKNRELDLLR